MTQSTEPFLLLREERQGGVEVWAQYDAELAAYELFASQACDDYLGVVDDLEAGKRFALDWFAEWRANS